MLYLPESEHNIKDILSILSRAYNVTLTLIKDFVHKIYPNTTKIIDIQDKPS